MSPLVALLTDRLRHGFALDANCLPSRLRHGSSLRRWPQQSHRLQPPNDRSLIFFLFKRLDDRDRLSPLGQPHLFALLHRFHRRGEVLVALSQSHVHPELSSIVVISLVMISLHNLLSSIGASNSEPWSRDEVARPVSTPPLYASIRTI